MFNKMMKKVLSVFCMPFLILTCTACGNNEIANVNSISESTSAVETISETNEITEIVATSKEQEYMKNKMNVTVGNYTFTATLEDNDAVKELLEMMQVAPIVLKLDDYSGFEKVGSLGRNLTRSDSQTTTKSGDIVLYNGNNIVIFYDSNSWSYTRLGNIDDITDWEKALGSGSVTVTFSLMK